MESRLEVRDNVLKEEGPIVIAHNAGDGVVAGTRTWTFLNATFTGELVGQILEISGAANAGNNGKFVIEDVPSATTLVTKALNPLTTEGFGGGVVAHINMDPCWCVSDTVTQIQISFGDGTVVQANGAEGQDLWEAIKSFVKQAEMRGIRTGGPYKWYFSAKGTACNQVPENLL